MFGSQGFSRHADVLERALPSEESELIRLVEEIKRRANQAFSASSLEEAEVLYSHGIDITPKEKETGLKFQVHVLYSNRSATRLKMDKLQEALVDANAAIEWNETYAKGYFRKAQTCMKLKQYAKAVAVLEKAAELEPSNKSVEKMLQEAIALRKQNPKEIEMPLSPKKKTVYNSTGTISTNSPRVSKPQQPAVEMIDDENIGNVRGYKKLDDGRVTTYFNNVLTEEAKKLIGDIAPKRINDEKSVQIKNVDGGSAWNQGNTFEEKDMTNFAQQRVKELLQTVSAPLQNGSVRVVQVKDMKGDASIAVVRGSKRYIFDLYFNLECEWISGSMTSPIKGIMKFVDVSSDCGGNFDVEVVVEDRFQTNEGKSLHTFLSSKQNGIQSIVQSKLNQFIQEFQQH